MWENYNLELLVGSEEKGKKIIESIEEYIGSECIEGETFSIKPGSGYSKYQTAQLCEIAYITGTLTGKGTVRVDGNDLEQMLEKVYGPMLNTWESGIDNNEFICEEEEGYISAYAQRKLVDLYAWKK